MQHLETLWNLVNAVGTVRDLASEQRKQSYFVPKATTLYLHLEASDIKLRRVQERHITLMMTMQPSFGWRIHSEQDDAGVYLVAKPRQGLGSVARASFDISAPEDTYFIIKAEGCQVSLGEMRGTLHIQPDGMIQTR